jgi:hypothetical protein
VTSAEYQVENAVSNGVVSEKWRQPLDTLLREIAAGSHRLASNYHPDHIDLAGHRSFDLLLDRSGRIVSFCGVYNGGRYPEGVYRILNRTWVADSLRVGHGVFPFLTSKYILPVQIENLRDELKLIFVSREEPSGKFFLRKWRERQSEPQHWQVSENMIQVVPGVSKASCYQYICSRRFQPVNWNPQQIDEAQWAAL